MVYSPWGHKELDMTDQLTFFHAVQGEGYGMSINSVKLSCRSYPADPGMARVEKITSNVNHPDFMTFVGEHPSI